MLSIIGVMSMTSLSSKRSSELCQSIWKHTGLIPDSDDDDEEENEAASKDGEVKREPGEGSNRQEREKTPAFELHVYSEDELSKLSKRELIADAELLDGTLSFRLHKSLANHTI